MADSLRYIGVGRQAAKGVAAATINFLNFVEKFAHKPGLTKDVPSFKTNQRWARKRGFSKHRVDEVTIDGRLDSTDFGWLLCSAFGAPTGPAANIWTWLAGQVQASPITGLNSMLLTVVWGEGVGTIAWQMIDARVAKLNIKIDALNNITYVATLRGTTTTKITAPTPAYTPPADNSPFEPWNCVIQKNAVAACIVSFEFDLDNHYDPFYCTPIVTATPGQDHGLVPSRFTEGEVEAKFKCLYEFTTFVAGEAYYDYLHDLTEAWIITCKDMDTVLGATNPGFSLALPTVFGTTGDIQRDKPESLQAVDGEVLFNSAAGTGATATLTNAQALYTGS